MNATSLGLSYIEIVLRIVLSLVIGGVIGSTSRYSYT